MENLNEKDVRKTSLIQNYIDYSKKSIEEMSSKESGFRDSLQLPAELKAKLAAIAEKEARKAKTEEERKVQEKKLAEVEANKQVIQDVLDELNNSLGR